MNNIGKYQLPRKVLFDKLRESLDVYSGKESISHTIASPQLNIIITVGYYLTREENKEAVERMFNIFLEDRWPNLEIINYDFEF